MKERTHIAMEGLPTPHGQYALAGNLHEVDVEPRVTHCCETSLVGNVMDSSDAAVQKQQEHHDVYHTACAYQSKAMQRHMPRPLCTDPVHPPPSMSASSLQVAEAILASAVAAVVEHDSVRYRPCGATASKRRAREKKLLHNGPSAFEVQHNAEIVQHASRTLLSECRYLMDKYGYSGVPISDVAHMMQVSAVEYAPCHY